ncbi:response regulator [Spirosoma sp. BT702]|uniref:histidine kinase n=1 Tax=Spirosoma profusum TaxID=2771354 RepID=A0A926XTK3_9BACT|nr:ATP-binding protein [Spirosoma profusum]MBD2699076.1 response regulator [Spirosoma profusum]
MLLKVHPRWLFSSNRAKQAFLLPGYLLLLTVCILPTLRAQSFNLPRPELITARQGLPQAFVPAIVQDRQGFIWMATRDGLSRYDGRNFKVFQPTTERASLSSSSMADIQTDSSRRLWILSEEKEIDIFDPARETFINFSRLPFFRRALGQERIEKYYPDNQNRLWLILGKPGKLICIDLATNRIHRFPELKSVITVRQNLGGPTWVATKNQLYRQDKQTGRLISWFTQPETYQSRPDTIQNLYVRPDGLLMLASNQHMTILHPQQGLLNRIVLPTYRSQWKYYFATDSRGNTFFNLDTLLLRFNPQQDSQRLETVAGSRYCRSMFIDQSDVLWMGTNGYGIRKYNLRAAAFDARPYNRGFQNDVVSAYLGVPADQFSGFPLLSSPYKFRYTFDKQGQLWFNAGITPFLRLNLATKQITPIQFPIKLDPSELNLTHSASLATDPDGRVWAIYDTLVVYQEEGRWKRFPFSIQSTVGLPVNQLVVDRQALWLATVAKGLYRVDRTTGQVRHYASQPNNVTSLSSNELIGLFADPLDTNLLWIGTFGSGLCRFDKRTGQCRRLTTQDGLPNNVVYSAIPDRRGGIWVGTNQGLCRVDRRTLRTRTYTQEDGLQADEFNRFHNLHLPDDRIILGGVDGITAFDPQQIGEDTYQPDVQLTDIQINNKPFKPDQDSLSVQAMPELVLPHDQNFVTVGFAAMQYNRQTKIRYRYRLEGLNDDWIYTDRPVAEYTGLRPGSYILRVNASNTSGHWSSHVRTLHLTIQSPWWGTFWAYACYVLLSLLIVYVLAQQYRRRLFLQQSVVFKQKESAHLREVDAMKTRFFTNITHEFRTPLTLILTPIGQMMQEERSKTDKRRLDVIDRNAHQLLGLINQLLDLSKLESGHLSVNESRGSLDEFIGERIQSFSAEAESKEIQLTYQSQIEGDYWFDMGKLECILYNLVANALKFTSSGGSIRVTLKPGIYLTVSDTGIGIPADKIDHIFNRFYQATSDSERSISVSKPEGTGIGLALVKEFIGLQGGSINVVSQEERGSTFTVFLPYRRVVAESLNQPVVEKPVTYQEDVAADSSTNIQNGEAPTILLVEDNLELLEFITSSLPATYRIHQATNGLQGFEEALKRAPDLIISDVMMPGMDGFTLCRKLKEDPRTNYIPVVLLTARTAMDSRLQGLTEGADDYLTKPFNLHELRLRITNLLERQRRFRDQMRKVLTSSDATLPATDTSVSNPFLEQLYTLLDTHLDDSTFGVDELADKAYLSRMHLHRKLKNLTGLSTSDFIRAYRLKRATQLLIQGQPVSQTAYAVGFESPAYFTRSFRQLYGLTPSDYATQAN